MSSAFDVLNEVAKDPEFLLSVRLRSGLSIAELARAVQTDRWNITRWESGKTGLFERSTTDKACSAYIGLIARMHEQQSKLFRFAQTVAEMAKEETDSRIAAGLKDIANGDLVDFEINEREKLETMIQQNDN